VTCRGFNPPYIRQPLRGLRPSLQCLSYRGLNHFEAHRSEPVPPPSVALPVMQLADERVAITLERATRAFDSKRNLYGSFSYSKHKIWAALTDTQEGRSIRATIIRSCSARSYSTWTELKPASAKISVTSAPCPVPISSSTTPSAVRCCAASRAMAR